MLLLPVTHSVPPVLPFRARLQEQQQDSSNSDVLKDLATYLTLEKAQVGLCMRSAFTTCMLSTFK